MGKVLIAMALFAISHAANAIGVILISHEQTAGSGTISTLITDGSHVQGQPASTAVFDWDGSTLTSTGLYSATSSLSSSPYAPTILNDQITDLSIATGGTPGGVASATAYTCVEGTFLSGVGANGCGGYTLGGNFTDDSTTVWSGTTVSQTIGGDDVSTSGPRTLATYDFGFDGFSGVDGMTAGDLIFIGNGLPLGIPDTGGERMTFQVVPVPAAAWLFGSALGLLGWARRRTAK